MKKRLVVGNWKMYIEEPKAATDFALSLRKKVRGVPNVTVMLAPPFPLIPTVAEILKSSPILVGAQTVSPHEEGAHTGEVSARMLKNMGASFVVIGHSERRAPSSGQPGESNASVSAELERAVDANLIPILCVGEREHESDGEHFSFIEEELTAALKSAPKQMLGKLIIAYEPVWAIGKRAEDAMKPAQLQEMTIFIRKVLADLLGRPQALKVPILYGGSVDETIAHTLVAEGGVSGFLVGRASSEVDSFAEIIKLCK